MAYQYLLFDLDGTITNSEEGILNSIRYSLRKHGREIPTDDILRTFVGPPLKESFINTFDLDDVTADMFVTSFREYFAEKGLYENQVYDGIEAVLAQLVQDGCILYVATSKPEKFAHKVLQHFDLDKYFAGIYGASMDSSRSKKGDVIHYALTEAGITELEKTAMIGDTKFDILGAYENGLASIGVLWGIEDKASLEQAQATFIIEEPSDLLAITEMNIKQRSEECK